jgi:hypothetical protein
MFSMVGCGINYQDPTQVNQYAALINSAASVSTTIALAATKPNANQVAEIDIILTDVQLTLAGDPDDVQAINTLLVAALQKYGVPPEDQQIILTIANVVIVTANQYTKPQDPNASTTENMARLMAAQKFVIAALTGAIQAVNNYQITMTARNAKSIKAITPKAPVKKPTGASNSSKVSLAMHRTWRHHMWYRHHQYYRHVRYHRA